MWVRSEHVQCVCVCVCVLYHHPSQVVGLVSAADCTLLTHITLAPITLSVL